MSQGSGDDVRITRITVGPYGENCYLLTDPATGEGVLVDPGADWEKIRAAAAGSRITTIVVTHRHGDHTGALQEARAASGAPVAAHPLDAPEIPGGADIMLEDGATVACGRHALRVLHTPGHTPGSISLLAGANLIGGDTVFPGGPGKTATPEAFAQTVRSLNEKIYVLPEDTFIHPGHGDGTTVGDSQKEYAVFASKPRAEMPCGDVLWASS